MEIKRKGVMEANWLIMEAVLVKKAAHMLCPNANATTTARARRMESLSETAMAVFAFLGFSAPSSLETLVLFQLN